MKTLVSIATALSITLFATAQNPKYISAMEKNIAILDTARSTAQLQSLANNFERIASGEKKEWLPNYYAAYCYATLSLNFKGDEIDTYCDKADAFINKADSINPSNSEIYAVKAKIAAARINVNPMTRGQKYGAQSTVLRDKAKALDPANPRPWLLEGQSKFYTPTAFGGGKTKAKPAFEKALTLFETFKPTSSIHPRWGKNETTYFLKKCDE
ncbi:MAG: hypothetical protein H0W84_04920 [Bacteroidetes bacterium]|nr:hypothetical protein [Bacteroidota bacterium]